MNPVAQYAVQRVFVDSVFITGARRDLDESAVAALAESIKRHGLQVPITVRVDDAITDPETGEVIGGYALIAGRHRLEAVKRLGEEMIPAIIRDCDEIDAEMWEIAENLHRADLTKAERDRQIRRYADLIEAKEAARLQSGQTVRFESKRTDKRGHRKEEAAAKIAKETGLSQRTVRRALNPAPPPPPVVEPPTDDELMEAWIAKMAREFHRVPHTWRLEFTRRYAHFAREAA